MAHIIEINDAKNGVLVPALPKLIYEIGSKGNGLYWSIFYLYATGDIGENKSIVDFEEEIINSSNGYCLSWEELKDLSGRFDQIFDVLIVGAPCKKAIKKHDKEEDLLSNCSIVIDLFDGACWKVYSEDESVIGQLENAFFDTKLSY